MKNITLSVPDVVYKRARIKAAERDTSVSALVSEYLVKFSEGATEAESLKRRMLTARESMGHYVVGKRVKRSELHDR
jgi:hypothetical protein